jgi:uncharacterized protein YkwD
MICSYKKALPFLCLLLFMLIGCFPSLAEDGSADLLAAKGESGRSVERLDYEHRLFLLMNQTRQKRGMRLLIPSRVLGEVARAHSLRMSAENFFSHINPQGLGPKERLGRAGYVWKAFGENIGCGQDTPEKILDTWMKSPSHRETLLDPVYSEVGIGLVRGGECRIYWTALFARLRSW